MKILFLIKRSCLVKYTIFLSLSFSIFAAEKGAECTHSENSCNSGLVCKERDLSMITHNARWGGITYADVAAMLNRSREHYESSLTENDLWAYTKVMSDKPIIKKVKISGKKDIPSNVKSFPYLEIESKAKKGFYWALLQGSPLVSNILDWRNKDDTKTISQARKYRGYSKVSEKKVKYIEYEMEEARGIIGISVHHILAYYYYKKASNGTYYQYLKSAAKNCSTSHKIESEICEESKDIMDEILNHLSDYRAFLRGVNPKSGTKDKLYFFDLPGGGQVVNLESHAQPVLGPEYCYSFRIDKNGLCSPPRKACTCAMEGEEPIDGKCCSLDNPSSGSESLIFPMIPLTVVNGICTTAYLPSNPYGPGDGDTVDYKIMLEEERTDSANGGLHGCEFFIKFNNVDRLNDLGLPVSTQQERKNSLEGYINHDWIMMLALEYLFIDPNYNDCLVPNFGGLDWSDDFSGESFSTIMKEYIAKPLKAAREQANSLFGAYSLENGQLVKDLGNYNCLANEDDCQKHDVFKIGFEVAERKEKALLEMENALLFGKDAKGGINSIIKCQDCPANPKRIITRSKKKTSENEIIENPTWPEVLREGYKNIKFNHSYAQNYLYYETNKRKAHSFKCSRSSFKQSAENAWEKKIRIIVEGIDNDQYLIDPPIPNLLGFNNLGQKISKNKRKMEIAEFRELITSKLGDYFPEFSSSDMISQSFLNVKNKNEFMKILKTYVEELALVYSRKIEADGKTSKKYHRIKSRLDSFYPGLEAAVEELGYYLNQLSKARSKRISCIQRFGPKKTGTSSSGMDSTFSMSKIDSIKDMNEKLSVTSKESGGASSLVSKLNLNAEGGTYNLEHGRLSDLSLSADSNVRQGYMNRNDEYHNRAAKRAGKRVKEREYVFSGIKDGTRSQEAISSSKMHVGPLLLKKVRSLFSVSNQKQKGYGIQGSNSHRADKKESMDVAIKKSSENVEGIKNKRGHVGKNSEGDDFLVDFDLDQKQQQQDVNDSILNDQMLNEIEKNPRKFQDQIEDSLFEKITKSYFRSGYKRILPRRMK